ncbi:sugar transport protein 4-like [Punica granatum]|uniref:Sugar transport protein 4-like n=2 Tax=Punica granatum TaxID=22663 RepID=A0A6P8CGF0_PUNGR|nr:sugar transport protein 4-like [Punica granatum]
MVVTAQTRQHEEHLPLYVIVTCMVAATGGLLFGYDIGISGGITTMDDFLKKFFPATHEKTKGGSPILEDEYCKYNNHLLTLFTSSLYLAALISSIFASTITRKYGRKASMFVGGSLFLTGALLGSIANKVSWVIVGRLFLGFGVGFCNQSVPVYLCEMAPAKHRGALNIYFQMAVTIGILAANFINFVAARIPGGFGWRVSIGLVAFPAMVMMVGALALSDTPISLIERGHHDAAKRTLQKIRGTINVEHEFQDLIYASYFSNKVEYPWKNILLPRYRPQLVICILIPIFQQLTGINNIIFYSPVLFKTMGFGSDASLISATITGGVFVVATVLSIISVDRFGRRVLFLVGGLLMMICQIGVGAIIGLSFGVTGEGSLSKAEANIMLALICGYVMAFGWSWAPLGWLVPSEISPVEARPTAQAITVAFNMLFTFIIAQSFLSSLCFMKFAIFFFFAFLLAIMIVFMYLFVPETRNVPLEGMSMVLKLHWFWGKYIPDEVILWDYESRLLRQVEQSN